LELELEVYINFQPGIFIASGTGEDPSKVFERNPVDLGDTSGSIVRDGEFGRNA